MALLFSKTSETKSGLTTSTVFLWQVNGKLVDHISGISAKRSEQGTITVHDDEAKLLIRFQELAQGFSMEFVITEVQRGVDWLEGLKIDIDLPFLPF